MQKDMIQMKVSVMKVIIYKNIKTYQIHVK